MGAYDSFLRAKVSLPEQAGFPCEPWEVNPMLKPHQAAMVCWAVQGGRRALFAAFGLGKSVMQLEFVRITLLKAGGGMGLIVIPLGVRQEFVRDAVMLGITVKFVRRIEECDNPNGIYLTNYETVRDGKLDPTLFVVASLDEASCLRGFGGTKTFREFMATFAGDRKTIDSRVRTEGVRYRLVATATPSPNEFIELLAYSAFLGIMDVGQAKTRFFKRNSEKADQLTIHPHKEREFWLWCASWGLFVQRPSDLGFSDEGYELPPLDVRWHEIPADHGAAGENHAGQGLMFKEEAIGIIEASREKRDSLPARIEKLMQIRAEAPAAHRILWHDLEAERHAIEKAIPAAVSVYGSQDLEDRERAIIDFSNGRFQELAAKPVIAGSGCNFQRHCSWAVFLGIGFKFNDFIQAVHRIQRFLQAQPVRIDLIYTEAERQIRRDLERKWAQHNEMVAKMTEIIREFGLSQAGMALSLTRKLGVERVEVSDDRFTCVNDDCVLETRRMAENSVGLVLTSIPFSTQYEYSPNYADFGHTENNAHFFAQMDFLVPELLRVLQPGRIAAIHVKDRIVPSGLGDHAFQTVYPFHLDTIQCFRKHGFGYMGMKTIVTDVVRENAQTYRLSWTEQCKDGTKMGVGMPEYLLIFRKPPSSTEKTYADVPVVKPKETYTRARWQADAHGFARSSGDRLIDAEHLAALPHDEIYQLFKKHSLETVYNYEHHVRVSQLLDDVGKLPSAFMLLQPQSWSDEVWADVTRMLTLNGAQSAKGKEMHLCLARGSLVLTRDGYIPIEEVTPGDQVLTHRGRWRKVMAARMTGESRDVIDLRAQGVAGLRLTPDHKVWTRRADGVRAVDAATKAEPGWLDAEATVGHYLNLKLPPVEASPLSPVECWLIGRWLADGHVGVRGDFWVSIGPAKLEEFERHAGEHAGTRSYGGTAVQVRLKGLSEAMKSVLRRCGRLAIGKRVPAELLSLNTSLASETLAGYLSGDGHYIEERQRWQASSASRALLLGFALLVQRVHGQSASLTQGRPAGEDVIDGRTVNVSQEWVLSFNDGKSQGRKQPFVLDDGAWKRVRSADPAGTSEVWCLKVEEDESFTAEGCIVKNCPMQFDIADRAITQWSSEGDLVYDPFGGLMTVPYRALKLRRRGYGCELSPQYFLDGVSYCQAMAREISMPSLFDTLATEVA